MVDDNVGQLRRPRKSATRDNGPVEIGVLARRALVRLWAKASPAVRAEIMADPVFGPKLLALLARAEGS